MARKIFKARLEPRGPGGAWTFVRIPFDVKKAFGVRARAAVKGTIEGYPFRTSVIPRGDGTHEMMVNKNMQKGAGVGPGERAKFVLEPDTEPRRVKVPADFRAALKAAGSIAAQFAKLAYSHRKAYVDWITSAKKEETRQRRMGKALSMLRDGKRLK